MSLGSRWVAAGGIGTRNWYKGEAPSGVGGAVQVRGSGGDRPEFVCSFRRPGITGTAMAPGALNL